MMTTAQTPQFDSAPPQVPPVPLALKWAVALGTIIPATLVGLLVFVVIGLGDAWSSSPYSTGELIALSIGAFILALAVLCYLAALLWHGVRGIRPVFLIIFVAPALLVGYFLPVIALGWILLAGCLLYNCSVSDFLRACRTVRSQLSQAEPQPQAENASDLQDEDWRKTVIDERIAAASTRKASREAAHAVSAEAAVPSVLILPKSPP